MGTPRGNFIRAKRDSIQPESRGLPDRGRRRSPGLRRLDLATWAGISVEYLTRIEQGRDRNPSPGVINALADALRLTPSERNHLRYLAKITGDECSVHIQPVPPSGDVRPSVLRTLRLLEPGVAIVTNRLGDVLAHTGGYELVTSGTGLLDAAHPNLNRYLFTDPRARTFFVDWDDIADEQAFDLWQASQPTTRRPRPSTDSGAGPTAGSGPSRDTPRAFGFPSAQCRDHDEAPTARTAPVVAP
ncbi:helix-turn-helix transcriptional regulator [Nonomuraea angiospora]|uniref:helix-turn-helix transcriptional regulator n=1 Tax=Nonomuraea angiospora TaxID=46172 RepID=UPI003329450E